MDVCAIFGRLWHIFTSWLVVLWSIETGTLLTIAIEPKRKRVVRHAKNDIHINRKFACTENIEQYEGFSGFVLVYHTVS